MNPKLSEERGERMWDVVEAAQKGPTRRRLWTAAAAVAIAAAVALAFLPMQERARRVAQGDLLVTRDQASDFVLPDGTSLGLSRASTLSVVEAHELSSRLRVERGRALFDVPQREGHNFVVEVRDVQVVMRGARFAVQVTEHEGPHASSETEIQVEVERGKVEIHSRSERVIATLKAGQSWSMQVHAQDIEPKPSQR